MSKIDIKVNLVFLRMILIERNPPQKQFNE
jgi:hypothetical protein